MDRWYYRVAISSSDIDSLINTLEDSDFNPNEEQKFDNQNRSDSRDVYLIRIDVEGQEHQNSADVFIVDGYNGIILKKVKKVTIPHKTKLRRDFFSRIWEILAIYFGTASTAIPTLITTSEGKILIKVPPEIHWIFLAALIPTVSYYVVGLRRINERYGSVKKKSSKN